MSRKQKRNAVKKGKREFFTRWQGPWYCEICNVTLARDEATIDHIMPLSLGGSPMRAGNLRMACESCNSRRGNRWDGLEGVARQIESYGDYLERKRQTA